ncbi:MAG TPA: tetratricopeptide repeat protein [Pyrinomonadaceae bacterium]|jgi:tetratricopeptide (TPR) repeat protein
MNKENILFSVIGLLLGCIVGFVFANTINQRGYEPGAQNSASKNPALPPDHPPVSSNGVADQGAPPAAVMEQIQQARNEPNNFDAQISAAQLYYQIGRFDEAIEFLLKANQLRPDDYATIVRLGDANFEAEHFEPAEKWYTAALTKTPDDADVRTDLGLTFFLRQPPDIERAVKEYRAVLERQPKHEKALQNLTVALIKKGDAKEAQTTLSQLEAVNPSNDALAKLRTDLQGLKTK